MNEQAIRSQITELRQALSQINGYVEALAKLVEINTELCKGEARPVNLTLWVDGGSRGNPGEGYGSYAVFEEGGSVPTAQDRTVFGQDMTNNEAEYDALLWGLERLHWTTGWCVPSNTDLTIKTDSALVCGQLRREKPWKVNADNLRERVRKAKNLLADFASWYIEKVPKAEVEAVLGH